MTEMLQTPKNEFGMLDLKKIKTTKEYGSSGMNKFAPNSGTVWTFC